MRTLFIIVGVLLSFNCLCQCSINGPSTRCSNDTIYLTAGANGNMLFQWTLDNVNIAPNGTSPTLAITPNFPAGIYRCKGSYDGINTVCTSNAINVSIIPSPAKPVTTNVTYCKDATAQPLSATGSNLLWYTSEYGGTGIASLIPSTNLIGSKAYYVTQTVNGCESNREGVGVSINEGATVTKVGNMLRGNYHTDATYQWANCNGYVPVAGQTSINFVLPSTGSYALIISNNGCLDTSDCFSASAYTQVVNSVSGLSDLKLWGDKQMIIMVNSKYVLTVVHLHNLDLLIIREFQIPI